MSTGDAVFRALADPTRRLLLTPSEDHEQANSEAVRDHGGPDCTAR